MKKDDKVFCMCKNCAGKRNHDVMYSYTEETNPEYRIDISYAIIKCRGCNNISFLRQVEDYEVMIPIDEEKYEPETTQEIYPKSIEDYKENRDIYLIPEIVRKIYMETISAIKNGQSIISGIGLRAIIEAICNDKDIKGRDLKFRINKLASLGIIARDDARRLHAIRFLGNDAVHDIKPAKKDSIIIALNIIDHTIQSLYTFNDSGEYLELPINEYIDLEKLILLALKKMSIGTKFTFAGILGKDIRRVEDVEIMEKEFFEKVKCGNYKEINSQVTLENNKNKYEKIMA